MIATKHGVFKTNERGEISDFLYQRPIEELKLISEDQVPTVVFLNGFFHNFILFIHFLSIHFSTDVWIIVF